MTAPQKGRDYSWFAYRGQLGLKWLGLCWRVGRLAAMLARRQGAPGLDIPVVQPGHLLQGAAQAGQAGQDGQAPRPGGHWDHLETSLPSQWSSYWWRLSPDKLAKLFLSWLYFYSIITNTIMVHTGHVKALHLDACLESGIISLRNN